MPNNFEVGTRLEFRRKQLGLTLDDIATEIGVARSTIQRYEKGNIDKLKLPVVEAVARALRVNPAWLCCKSNEMEETTQPSIFDLPGILPMPKMRKVPRLGTIARGEPILAEENIETYDSVPEDIHCDFTLICKGDSMINARVFDGDIVYINAQPSVKNGEIAAVLIAGDEATLKRVMLYEDHISLEPENPMFKPIVIWGEDMNEVRIIGKAIYFTSAVR